MAEELEPLSDRVGPSPRPLAPYEPKVFHAVGPLNQEPLAPYEPMLLRRIDELRSDHEVTKHKLDEIWPPRKLKSVTESTALFPVTLTQTGGSNGNKTTTATYTYKVYDLNGSLLLEDASPEWPRENGTRVAATKGLAYLHPATGQAVLSIAYEPRGTGSCPT